MRLSYIDLEQAESRVVGAICLRLFGDSSYLDAVEAGDIHSFVSMMNYPDLPWPKEFSLEWLRLSGLKEFPPEILRPARALAESTIIYRGKSARFYSKPLGHGSNYYGKPDTMSKHAHLPVQTIREFQRRYFSPQYFYCIRRWHEHVKETIQTTHQLTTMLGRRVIITQDPTQNSTLRAMIAFESQSVGTGDYMNAGIMRLDEANLPLHLLKQVHDAVAFEYDCRDEYWLIPMACDLISWSFDLTPEPERFHRLKTSKHLLSKEREDLIRLEALMDSPRSFHIPTEAMVGWNLAKCITKDREGNKLDPPKNPNGLVIWNPDSPDTRKRVASLPVTAKERLSYITKHMVKTV